MNQITTQEQKNAALIAGLSLLVMAFLAPFSIFYAIQSAVNPADPVQTVQNIQNGELLFRAGILGIIGVVILDVIAAGALNTLFQGQRALSNLTAAFRILYAGLFAAAANRLIEAVSLIHVDGSATVVAASITQFFAQWNSALIIFGIHAFLLGILMVKSKLFPKFLGVLVVIAGLGYFIDGCGKLLTVNYPLNLGSVTFIGEFLFIFWLIAFSRKKEMGTQRI